MPKSHGHGQALVLSQAQADAVIQACSPTLRAVFSFARSTAARISEVLSLKFENVTTTCVVLPKRIVKGKKKTREVPINDRLASEIRAWLMWHLIFRLLLKKSHTQNQHRAP